MEKNEKKYDVAVIGGGPAGMMAAGRAAEMGARVVLLEKNATLGKKLLITGKGRCNVTQAEFDDREMVKKFGSQGKFLFSSLAAFGPEEMMGFLEERGVAMKIERGGRVFPASDKAQDVLLAMQKYLKENKVDIIYGAEVMGFACEKDQESKKISYVKLRQENIVADKFILCTGGKSYATTGSTGDGYRWAEECGHQLVDLRPALVPIKTQEKWVTEVQGLSLKNVTVSLIQDEKKQDFRFGEMLFTHFGLSGPIVLELSKKAGELLEKGKVQISIDLKSALSEEQLDERLQRDFKEHSNKDFINYLSVLLPQKIISTIASLSGIAERKKINLITREERKKLTQTIKDLRLTMEGVTGYGQAIITSGGVGLREVDSKTMRSKIVDNLYFAGEILDLDGPTGGYNLQVCWSTGYAAGTYVAS